MLSKQAYSKLLNPSDELAKLCGTMMAMESTGRTDKDKRTFWLLAPAGLRARVPGRGAAMRLVWFVTVSGCLALGLSGLSTAAAQASSAPSEVVTEPVETTAAGVKLRGRLNPGGLPTTYYFAYGSDLCDESPECVTKTAVEGPLTGDTQQEVPSVEVTGLAAGPYWYRLVATNEKGTVARGDGNFTVEASIGASSAPSEVVTEPVETTATGVKLRGRLNPDGLATTYDFEYGSYLCDENPECVAKTAVGGPLTGDTQQEVPAVEVTGLAAGPYWYRLAGTNADGTVGGRVVNFTTEESISTLPPGGNNPLGGQGGQTFMWLPSTSPIAPTTTASPTDMPRPEASTSVRKLARALRACRRESRKRRAICARQARRKHALAAERASRSKR